MKGGRARFVVAVVLLSVGTVIAGCLEGSPGPDEADPGFDPPGRPPFETGRAVVAVIDSGVNPYHDDFARDERTLRASALLPRYPADGLVLPLTLDAATQQAAVAADAALWDLIEDETLYDVPGTSIVGMIAFGQGPVHPDAPRGAPGLDENGHGTAAAGMVAAACPACLLVTVEVGGATDGRRALAWLANQTWVDVIAYPARAGVGFVGAGTYRADGDTEFAWARDNAEAGQVVVVSSGNGVTEPTGTDPTAYTPARDLSYSYWTAGPDWVVTVGAADAAAERASAWHTLPVDVIAAGLGCDAPHPFEQDDRVAFEGTSCSAPLVAGQMGHVLASARDVARDGATGARSGLRLVVPADARIPEATREDLTRAYLLTAERMAAGDPLVAPDPTDPQGWMLGDTPVSPVHAGWGVHDEASLQAAIDVLVGRTPAPMPDDDEAVWFPVDRLIRLELWGPWDEGTSRFGFPEPLVGPVRVPIDAAGLDALYAAARAREGLPPLA